MIKTKPRYQSRNDEIVAELRASAGAGAPIDPKMAIKRKAAEISTSMALIHGGDWRVVVDHEIPMVVIRRV